MRGIAEAYEGSDSAEAFVHDFVKAWAKVRHLDRYEPA